MKHIVAIRPEPGGAATVAAGAAVGLPIDNVPLFEVRGTPWTMPPGKFDGLLIGSGNVFNHAGPGLHHFRTVPVHCVGAATAAVAHGAGFTVATRGEGGLQQVLDTLAPQRLLRLAGKDRVPLVVPAGIELETRVVYDVARLPMPASLAARLAGTEALVVLHSAAAARHFASECKRLELDRGRIALAALGPRIAAAAGAGWAAVRAAPQPNDAALLELARDMCH